MKDSDVANQRWVLLALVIATTAAATLKLFAIFETDGVTPLEWLVLAVYAILFSWIAAAFWVASFGAYEIWKGALHLPPGRPPDDLFASQSRTALAMPIYNEDWVQVCARIQAMQDSLREADALDRFDFFILSDSTDSRCRAAEEEGWRQLRRLDPAARVYYRRRPSNTARKSGNIADFCVNWGALYDYMIVLDADSLMTGPTLLQLAGLMDTNPRAAMIQVAPQLIGGETLFARMQQFASWLYGPIYATGLARFQGSNGNYWGHNAIIRVRPFMQHCGLPVLPGNPPFGGEIMSHDFVEAALLRRAGWDIWLVPQLGGSYEATPPTLIEHLKRDQRWCQGNLQHIKLVFARGFRMQSRIHLAFGAISYLSSPLWLALIVLFFGEAEHFASMPAVSYVGPYPVLTWPISHATAFLSLAAATGVLLYAPKFLALALLLRDRRAARAFGGPASLVLSVLTETIASTLLAPVLMLSHTWFVVNALVGRHVGWGPQRRGGEQLGLRASARAFAPHTILALIAAGVAWTWLPGSFWWFLPLLLGPVLAIILCWISGDPERGRAAARFGLFVVPSEATRIPIVERLDTLLVTSSRSGEPPAAEVERSGESLQAI